MVCTTCFFSLLNLTFGPEEFGFGVSYVYFLFLVSQVAFSTAVVVKRAPPPPTTLHPPTTVTTTATSSAAVPPTTTATTTVLPTDTGTPTTYSVVGYVSAPNITTCTTITKELPAAIVVGVELEVVVQEQVGVAVVGIVRIVVGRKP